jgi:S-adenosylmethionine hydrolase
VITLTTDFGLLDPFAGIMKGVILSISSSAEVVDLTHSIPPGNIRKAALCLESSCRWFPENSIHLAVVDPGVGTKRAPLVIKAGKYFFVGPDNGIFSLVLKNEKDILVVEADRADFMLPETSRTFHGRDVFAPLAAHLANEIPLLKLGKRREKWEEISFPSHVARGKTIEGAVRDLDGFGNLVTNIPNAELKGDPGWEIVIGSRVIKGVSASYGENEAGALLAVPGSSGYLEISVNGGSAGDILGVGPGERLIVRRMPDKEGTAD